jgi:hypothetical protein
MSRKTSLVSILVFCLLGFHSRAEGQCVPFYGKAAPDTLDTSGCQGFLPSYRLYKTSHWAIYWPGYGPFTNADPKGNGQCTFYLQCWPSFDQPDTIEFRWSQRVVHRKLNCDPNVATCTSCLYWGEKTYPKYAPCEACDIGCTPEGCDPIRCNPGYHQDPVSCHWIVMGMALLITEQNCLATSHLSHRRRSPMGFSRWLNSTSLKRVAIAMA